MAEEPQPAASEPAPQPKEVVVTEEAPPPPEEKAELTESAAAEAEEPKKETPLAAEAAEAEAEAEEKAMPQSVSFKEESNLVSDLADPEKKALDELKQLVAAALANRDFSLPPPPPPPAPAPAAAEDAPPPKPSETPDEPPKDDDAPKPPESEAPKPAEEEAAAPEETAPPPAPEETAPPPAPEEKAVEVVAVDDDGAKTVEAIEETVVPAPAAPEAEEAAETKTEAAAEEEEEEEEVRIWGVPIVGDERSDAVLLKFLRARDYKPADAMAMLRGAVLWRKRFGIEALLGADLGLPEMDRVVFTRGADREGHPVCYNVYGEFQSRELYDKAFGDDDRRDRFLKWRIQYLERGIRSQLDFSPGGVCSMVQVTDLRNSPRLLRLGKHRQVTRQALTLLQDNYPEFIAKKVSPLIHPNAPICVLRLFDVMLCSLMICFRQN